MAESAANRALRLIDLVPYLVAHPGSNVKDVAKVFEITVPELLKDLEILFMCGLPGYTPLELIDLSVEGGVISIRDPQNLDNPRRFSEMETLVVRVALAALEELLPPSKREKVSETRRKVGNIFKGDVPNEAIFFEGDPAKSKLEVIRKALEQNVKLRITYLNQVKNQISSRSISVRRIVVEKSRTLIEAWCDVSQGIRTFNLAQMQSIELTDEVAEIGVDIDSKEVLSVRFSIHGTSRVVEENADQVRRVGDLYEIDIFQSEWLIRQTMAEGAILEIKSPVSFREAIAERAKAALKNY